MINLPQRVLQSVQQHMTAQVLIKALFPFFFHLCIHRQASLMSSWSLWRAYLKTRTKKSIPLWVTQHHASSPRMEVPTKTSNQRISLIFKSKMSFNLIYLFVKCSCEKVLLWRTLLAFWILSLYLTRIRT